MSVLKSAVKRVIGLRQRQQIRSGLRRIGYFGLSRYCTCCKAHVRDFAPAITPYRPNVFCPVCGAKERHRLVSLYLRQKTDLYDGRPKKFLHVAPEPHFVEVFKSVKNIDYLSADLNRPEAMVKMDITDIQYPDNSFDVIYCSHVLEHIPEDRRAMRELRRVLKPEGWAILQVPITSDVTVEDPTITTPEDRKRVYGQSDHVRRYGPDYADRLRESGFALTIDAYPIELGDAAIARFGLQREENVYFCRKS